jgi:trans-aconitate methyltransferase
VLDYGCGEGRYLGVLRDCFPRAHVVGGDISEVALEHAARRHPDAEWVLMDDERFPNSTVPSI